MEKLSKKKLYEYYSSQGEDRERMYFPSPFREYCQKRRLEKIEKLVDTSYDRFRKSLILDIGCGDGFCTSFIVNVISYKYLIGLDLSLSKLAKAKEQLESFCGFVGDAEYLPFAENSFDCVFCFETLEHLSNPLKVINEIKKVLKPTGLCFISIPLVSSWQEKIVNITKRIKRIFNIDYKFKEHIQFFPMKKVLGFFRESGLEIVDLVRIGFKFPFQETAFRILGDKRINRLDEWLSEKIPVGAFGYKGLSIGNEFLLFGCRHSKKVS